jgi:uncharacterized protein YuzE
MTLQYDKQTDSLSIRFRTAEIESSEEITPGVLVDIDENGGMISMEILNASNKVESLDTIVINSKRILVD